MAEKDQPRTSKGNLDAGHHETVVTPVEAASGEDRFQASCTCGFRGAERSTQTKADSEAQAHVAKVADTVPE